MTKDLEEHFKRYQKQLGKARESKTSYMNNTKWFKFFSAVRQADIFMPQSQLKFLLSDEAHPFDFEIEFNETGKLDGADGGPFYFNEIEWILIPAVQEYERFNRDEKLQSSFKTADLPAVVDILQKLGKYEFEMDENGLKIYGYK